MDIKKSNITPSEWEIMRVIWTQGEATSKEIFEILNKKTNWKNTTVKTLLGRLVDKDMLSTQKSGNKFIYFPIIKERDSINDITNDLLSKVCSTKIETLLENIISKSELSFDDIDRLEYILKEKRKTAVDIVKCNCIPGQCQCHLHQ